MEIKEGDDITDLIKGVKEGDDVTSLINGSAKKEEPKKEAVKETAKEKPFLQRHPAISDLIGVGQDDAGKLTIKAKGYYNAKNPLPEGDDKTWSGWGYNRLVRPMLDPANQLIEAAAPAGMAVMKPQNALAQAPKAVAAPVIQPKPKPKLLGPAPDFIAGKAGIVPNRNIPVNPAELGLVNMPPDAIASGRVNMSPPPSNQPAIADLGHLAEQKRQSLLSYGGEGQQPGSRLTLPDKPPIGSPVQSGDTRLGFSEQTNPEKSIGYPLDVVPNRVRPRTIQSTVNNIVPDSMKSAVPDAEKVNFISAEPQMPTTNSDIGPVNPYQQPSAPYKPIRKPKITPPVIDVKPSAVVPAEPLGNATSKIAPKELSPVDAVRKWGYGRNYSKTAASEARAQFAHLKDKPELVNAFQSGDRTGPLKDVSNYFDTMFKKLTENKVLEPEQYKENYLKQLWKEDPDTVDAVFKKYRIAKDPGLSKESTFKSYKQGIAAGLTPKYDNISDIAGAFAHEANNAIHDANLKSYLEAKGVPVTRLSDTSTWNKLAAKDPEAAKMMSNYFEKSPDWLHKTANAVSSTKNIALTQGFPGRTGTVSAHGFNLLSSDAMARGFGPALSDFFKSTYSPAHDVKYVQENAPKYLKSAIEHGLNWQDVDNIPLNHTGINAIVDKIPGVSQLNEKRIKLFEDPLWKVKYPASKLKMYVTRFEELKPKLGADGAATYAAKFANDFAGGVDKTFESKSKWDAARIVALAPDWLRSRANITAGALTGKPGYLRAGLRGAAIEGAPIVSGIGTMGVGKYLASKPSISTGINIGTVGDKQRTLEPGGTSVEPQRAMIQNATQMFQGNIGYPLRYLGNKASAPFEAAIRLKENIDPFGNPLWGKDRFGRPISAGKAALNIGAEATRPIVPSPVSALLDYAKGNTPAEEIAARSLGLPITYTSIPKGRTPALGGGVKVRLR
jgi:hypothetical protein